MSSVDATSSAVDDDNLEGGDVVLGEDGKPLSKKALKKLELEKKKAAEKAERAAKLEAEKKAREEAVRALFYVKRGREGGVCLCVGGGRCERE